MAILGCIFFFFGLLWVMRPLFCLASGPARLPVWKASEKCWDTSRSARHPGGLWECQFWLVLLGHLELYHGDQSSEFEKLWGIICNISHVSLGRTSPSAEHPPQWGMPIFILNRLLPSVTAFALFTRPETGCRSLLNICSKRMMLSLIILFGFG